MIKKETCTVVEHLGGGEGKAKVYHIVSNEDLHDAGRLYAKVVLEPGSSVGWHKHVNETEPYYILSGEGTFIDHDGSRHQVSRGDICTIENGQYHSIENTGTEDLEFMALIYNLPAGE